MKTPNERGETKSAPQEIQKLPTKRCALCGLTAVAPIVVDGACRNTAACAKRRRRAAPRGQET